MNDFGVSFAPTRDNAAMGPRNGQLTGVPQATQILSLALPRVIGARPVAPTELLTSQGGQGIDPNAAALLQTILRTLRGQPQPGQPGSLPGGTAGPNPSDPMPRPTPPGQGPGREHVPSPSPFPVPQDAPLPMPSTPGKPPRIHPEDPGGGWTPGMGPYEPRPRPNPLGGRIPR